MIKIDDKKFLEMTARGFGCAEWVWVRECESLMLGEVEQLQECYYDEVYLDGEVWISWEDWLEECTEQLIEMRLIAMIDECLGDVIRCADEIDRHTGYHLISCYLASALLDIRDGYKKLGDTDISGLAEQINLHGRY